jgi:DNA polymerase-3 subunit chi
MTEVLFYHLQNMSLENVLPPLLEKTFERGWRAVVHTTSEERADALDAHLWTYRDDSFLPHATWRIQDASEQPIVLTIDGHNPNRATVMVFDGDDGVALEAARTVWADCKSRGFDVTYWQTDDRGRWQRRQ